MEISPDTRGHREWPSHSRALLVVSSVLKSPPSSMGFRLERHPLRSKLCFLKESPDVLRPPGCRLQTPLGPVAVRPVPCAFHSPVTRRAGGRGESGSTAGAGEEESIFRGAGVFNLVTLKILKSQQT